MSASTAPPDELRGEPLSLTVRFDPHNLPQASVNIKDLADLLEGRQEALDGHVRYEIVQGNISFADRSYRTSAPCTSRLNHQLGDELMAALLNYGAL